MEEVVASQEKQCVEGLAVLGASSGVSMGAMLTIESMEDVWWVRIEQLLSRSTVLILPEMPE
jgi:hypothetical protein